MTETGLIFTFLRVIIIIIIITIIILIRRYSLLHKCVLVLKLLQNQMGKKRLWIPTCMLLRFYMKYGEHYMEWHFLQRWVWMPGFASDRLQFFFFGSLKDGRRRRKEEWDEKNKKRRKEEEKKKKRRIRRNEE